MGSNDHSRDYHLLRKIRLRHGGGPRDPAIAALLDHQIEESIKHAQEEMDRSPRAGIRTWLKALCGERRRRTR